MEGPARAGQIERLAHHVIAHVQADLENCRDLHLDPASIVESELGHAVAVRDRSARRIEGAELAAARGKWTDPGPFRRPVQQKIVKTLVHPHRDLVRRPGETELAAIVGVAELMANEALGIERKAHAKVKAIPDL